MSYKSVVPVHGRPNEIAVSEPSRKAPRSVDTVKEPGKDDGDNQRGCQLFCIYLFWPRHLPGPDRSQLPRPPPDGRRPVMHPANGSFRPTAPTARVNRTHKTAHSIRIRISISSAPKILLPMESRTRAGRFLLPRRGKGCVRHLHSLLDLQASGLRQVTAQRTGQICRRPCSSRPRAALYWFFMIFTLSFANFTFSYA